MIDLQPFCHVDRAGMDSPFFVGGYTYATNGWLIIRFNGKQADERQFAPDISTLNFPSIDDNITWEDLPDFDLFDADECAGCAGTGKIKECTECHGYGEVVFANAHNDYECECKTCKGEGMEPSYGENGIICEDCNGSGFDMNIPVQFGDRYIMMKSLYLIEKLPGIKISADGEEKEPFKIKFDGGVGLVMPAMAPPERKR